MPTKKTAKKGTASGSSRARAAKKPPKKAGRVAQAGAGVFLINMIPRSLSAETNQDSEPSITVKSAAEIVGTAFTPDPMGGPLAPIYVSTDGGNTWRLNTIVPSTAGSSVGTSDISLAFS